MHAWGVDALTQYWPIVVSILGGCGTIVAALVGVAWFLVKYAMRIEVRLARMDVRLEHVEKYLLPNDKTSVAPAE